MTKSLPRYVVAFIVLSLVNCWSAAVLTTAPRKGTAGNRFLFIVDTSSPMKRLDQAGRQVVYDFVHSGLEGRIHGGDTFGVWTFGQDVKGGVFPMQTWSSERSPDLGANVGRFLKEQSSGRKSQVSVVLTNAETLARSVKDVDIVIITSAAAEFKGDDTWAYLQQSWNARVEEARKNKKAIIIALAARSGRILQATVTLQGEPLQLAAPPDRRSPQQMTSNKASASEPPKPVREPIIMRGTPQRRSIDQIPTKFSPPPTAPAEPPAVDPLFNPAPEPAPVPVRGPEKPIVETKSDPDLTVAAREPGKGSQAAAQGSPAAITPRMLIVAGITLMVIAGILGIWILIHVRSRNRVSYISRSMANKP
jgi:hypothetical protein